MQRTPRSSVRSTIVLAALAGGIGTLPGALTIASTNQTATPYAGQEQRAIKALSEDEIKGFLSGSGAGHARAAELNNYPGPLHVIELASRLNLSEAQLAAMRTLMDTHKAEARRIGAEVVKLERELDALFATGTATAEAVEAKSRQVGIALARYRASHLTTHIAATRLLEPAQVERYSELRGYRGGTGHDHNRHH